MGRQTGTLQVTGGIGNLSFYYHRVYGYLVRRKGGPSREKVKHSPAFARTRENASEFGSASGTGKLIRTAIRSALGQTGDLTAMQRLTQRLVKITQLDNVHPRGERKIASGLATEEGRGLLESLALIADTPPDRILRTRFHYDAGNGSFTIADFSPGYDLVWPQPATHVRIQGMTGVFDADRKTFKAFATSVEEIGKGQDSAPLVLTSAGAPDGEGFRVGAVSIVFFQERNGELYALKEGRTLALVC